MKKLLILLAAAALSAGSAAAQTSTQKKAAPASAQNLATNAAGETMQPRPQQGTPEQQADRLTKQLGLSADQRTRVVALEQARHEEMQAMRSQTQGGGGDRAAMRQNMQTQRDKYDTQLKGILTAEQYTKFSQQREERGDQDKQGGRKTKTKTKS